MLDLNDLVSRMGNVPHFKALSESARKEIVFAGQILSLKAGSVIFCEGAPGSGIYVLIKGCVHLTKLGLQGQETIITVIKPIIMFNEVTVLDNGPNPVSGIAYQDCILWHMTYDRYQILMQRYPELGTGLLGVMAERTRKMLDHIENLISRPVLARTAKVLLDLSDGGMLVISRRQHTNQEIAALVATVPGAVSRSLKNLKELGAIRLDRHSITVRSKPAMVEIAQVDPMIIEAT